MSDFITLEDGDEISAETLYKTLVQENDRLSQIMMTVSSAFLGAIILFLEKVTKEIAPATLFLLWIGCLSFVVSILSTLFMHKFNISGIMASMENDEHKILISSNKIAVTTYLAIAFLVIGVLSLALFFLLNVHAGK